jgi:hypothetical protein
MSDAPGARYLSAVQRFYLSRWPIHSLYAGIAVFATYSRGIEDPRHTTFKIYRAAFWHLVRNLDLYAHYPAEQGARAVDLFKYSPTAALLFAPFAGLPMLPSMLLWSLLNSLGLCLALEKLLDLRQARAAQWLLLAETLASVQAMQSNAFIAALLILGFVAMERRRQLRAAAAIVTAAALKIFPAALLLLGLGQPRRPRFALIVTGVALAAFLLPLLVVSPAALVQQYDSWFAVESYDQSDLVFGLSVMHLLRHGLGVTWPNWPIQLLGTVAVALPGLLRRDRWRDPAFRLAMLSSLLAFMVLFNHQAERATFVIGVTGVVIWYLQSRQGPWRTTIMLLSVGGLQTVPLLAAWLAMQYELWRWPARTAEPSRLAAGESRLSGGTPAAVPRR